MPPSNRAVPESKWVEGVSPAQPLSEAAQRILQARLAAPLYWLPLAAEKSDEDVEYVHQLRVSTRRAVEAVRVFSDTIPKAAHRELRGKLRQLRRAADEARNLDVLCADFLCCTDALCENTCGQIVQAIRNRRRDAQLPIVAIHEELAAERFSDQVSAIIETVQFKGNGESESSFGREAPRYLKPVLKKFFRASQADFSSDQALHQLRIRTKKLRYTMELVSSAFPPCFRERLYSRITALQEIMGAVNDHATARTFFGDWISKTDDALQEAFFRGILLAECKAHEGLRQTFFAVYTPRAVKKLKRQFRDCCSLPP